MAEHRNEASSAIVEHKKFISGAAARYADVAVLFESLMIMSAQGESQLRVATEEELIDKVSK